MTLVMTAVTVRAMVMAMAVVHMVTTAVALELETWHQVKQDNNIDKTTT